jgi:hypothetical protein
MSRKAPWTPETISKLFPTVEDRPTKTRRKGKTNAKKRRDGPPPKTVAEALAQTANPGIRSDDTFLFVMLCLEHGHDDATIRALAKRHDPTLDKYGDRTEREINRILKVQRPRHDHVGATCADAGCPTAAARNTNVVERCATALARFDAEERDTRTRGTDRMVLAAALRKMICTGKLKIDYAQRDWALSAAVSRNTIPHAAKRLRRYVEQISTSGRVDANSVRLLAAGIGPHIPQAGRVEAIDELLECGSILAAGLDATRRGALQKNATPTWKTLRTLGNSTPAKISEVTPFNVRTIRDHLQRLHEGGLAEKGADGRWVALDRDPVAVAEDFGTLGTGEREAQKHDVQRKGYRARLAYLDAENERRNKIAEEWIASGARKRKPREKAAPPCGSVAQTPPKPKKPKYRPKKLPPTA